MSISYKEGVVLEWYADLATTGQHVVNTSLVYNATNDFITLSIKGPNETVFRDFKFSPGYNPVAVKEIDSDAGTFALGDIVCAKVMG